MRLRLLLLLLALAVLFPSHTPAAAQEGLDPTRYLLSESDLPAGFAHDPEQDKGGMDPDTVVVTRWYQQGASIINLVAADSDSPAGATAFLDQMVANFERQQGVEFRPVADLGEAGVYGYTDGLLASHHVAFLRQGKAVAGLFWTDVASARHEDETMELIRKVEALVKTTR